MSYAINYKEVKYMPRRDGTGPMGAGPMTGRGLGFCTGANALKYGAGLAAIGLGIGFACRRGFGRGLGRGFGRGMGFFNQTSEKTQKELLNEEKTILQNRLEVIEKELEDL
jgi:hypothetical protein